MISVATITEVPAETLDQSRRDMFLRLMGEYQAAIHRLANAYVTSPADREDLVQEIATELWKSIPRFRGESSERTWLYRIAHNTAITASMKIRRKTRTESDLESAPEPSIPGSNRDEELIRSQKRQQMIDAIRRLSALDRQLVMLHLEGLSYADIQEISGLKEGAIATRLSRIRDHLTQDIREREGGTK